MSMLRNTTGSGQEGRSNENSRVPGSQQRESDKKRQRQNDSNVKGSEIKSNESRQDSQNKKQRHSCTHCYGAHMSQDCWTLTVNADKRPPNYKSKESPKRRDMKVSSGNAKDFRKKKSPGSKFKGKKHVGKAS